MRFYDPEFAPPSGARKFAVVQGQALPADTSDQRWEIIRQVTEAGLWSVEVWEDGETTGDRIFAFLAPVA